MKTIALCLFYAVWPAGLVSGAASAWRVDSQEEWTAAAEKLSGFKLEDGRLDM